MSAPLLSRRQTMIPPYCPGKVVKTLAISSRADGGELLALPWPMGLQAGTHGARDGPLKSTFQGEKKTRNDCACGAECVEIVLDRGVWRLRPSSHTIFLWIIMFSTRNLAFNNISPMNQWFNFSYPKLILKCYTWKVTLVSSVRRFLIDCYHADVSSLDTVTQVVQTKWQNRLSLQVDQCFV